MRDRIARLLERAGRDLPAEQILREALKIQSPNAFAAEKVLKGIIGSDRRFRHRQGLWGYTPDKPNSLKYIAALHLDWSAHDTRSFRGAIALAENGSCWEFSGSVPMNPHIVRLLREARSGAGKCQLIVWKERTLRVWNQLLRSARLPEWADESLAVSRLAALVFPSAAPKSDPEDFASLLDLAVPDMESPASQARFLASASQRLLDLVPPDRSGSLSDVAVWIAENTPKVDFSRFAFGRGLIAHAPESPGVYLMRNRAGEVIYVGKAGNLRRRLRSYFTPRALKESKTAAIHNQLYALELLTCATEVEALVLEMRMIRDFRPSINLQEEVHEQPSPYGHGRNLLLLVPVRDKVDVYFVKDGAFISRLSVPLGSPPSGRLTNRIRTVYFDARKTRVPKREAWETEIVARWLAAHRKRLNFIDIDESGTCASLLRRLEFYLKDPDRLTRKVHYL
jgi:hypothetical protein